MKAIVTGGAGFIGSHLVDLLKNEKVEITVLDNLCTGRAENLENVLNNIELVECDIGIKGNWDKHFKKVDWVFHLAALADIVPSIQNPEDYFKANVDGTFNVLQASKNAGIKKFIYIASSSCYGIPEQYPTNEKAEIRPQYPYAMTKRIGEELTMHWEKVYNLPALSLRFFNVYGPRSRTSGVYGAVFGVFLGQKLAGKPFTVVGDGNQTRDFTFVKDICKAILAAAKSDRTGEIYNVGSGKTISINYIVDLLGGEKVHIPKRPGEPNSTFADISKFCSEIGWEPEVSIEKGVEEMVAEIDSWVNAPVWTPDTIEEATKDWFHYLS